MGLNWSTTKFSDFSIHHLIRGDFKYINFKKNVEIKYSNPIKLKNVISGYYKGFAFKGKDFSDEGEVYAIKGDIFNSDFSIDYDNASFLPIDHFEDNKYEKFKVSKNDIIVSLVGSIGKMVIVNNDSKALLNQNNIALQLDETKYDIKLFSYILKDKIKRLVESVYKNSGYSFLAIDDLFNLNLPKLSNKVQVELVEKIKPMEEDIKTLKTSQKKDIEIINSIFSDEFNFNFEAFNKLKSEKIVSSSLVNFSNNIDCRFGYRFQHKSGKYMMDFLKSKTSKRIKDYVAIPISLGKSVSPSQYDEDGEYYYMSMATVKKYYFDKEDAKKVSDEYSSKNLNKAVEKNDIIMTRSGAAIGKFALIKKSIKGIYADFTMRIRLENYNYQLAYYYFRSVFFQQLITTHKKGLQNHNIFPSMIQEFPIPDWTIEKQNEICDSITKQIDAQKEIDRKIEQKQYEIKDLIQKAIDPKI